MCAGLEKECHRSYTSGESQSCYSRRTRGDIEGGRYRAHNVTGLKSDEAIAAVLALSAQTSGADHLLPL